MALTLEALNQDRLYRSTQVQQTMSRFENQLALLQGNFTTVYMLGQHLRDDPKLAGALESNVMMYAERASEAIEQVRAQMSAELRGEADSDSAAHPAV